MKNKVKIFKGVNVDTLTKEINIFLDDNRLSAVNYHVQCNQTQVVILVTYQIG